MKGATFFASRIDPEAEVSIRAPREGGDNQGQDGVDTLAEIILQVVGMVR